MSTHQHLNPNLIAPCGMNCGLCLGYLREKNHCIGCRSDGPEKASHCASCKIKNCEKLAQTQSGFCYECADYPCARIKHMDKRYQTQYGMSMIENQETIRNIGLTQFVAQEEIRWTCPACGARICVHRPNCQQCGTPRLDLKNKK